MSDLSWYELKNSPASVRFRREREQNALITRFHVLTEAGEFLRGFNTAKEAKQYKRELETTAHMLNASIRFKLLDKMEQKEKVAT